MRRQVGYAVAWVLAVVVAVSAGVVTVTEVGASVRGRGPLGNEVIRTDPTLTPRPQDLATTPLVSDTIEGEWGAFLVGCQGVFAVGIEARPDEAAGWRVVSYEPGPDDDVDAVFRQGTRTVEVEVFCLRGAPTIAEVEYDEIVLEDERTR